MKVEIRCPSCQKVYLVDEAGLGSELPCPGCAVHIAPRIPASPSRDLPVLSADESETLAEATSAAVDRAVVTAPVARPPADPRPAQKPRGAEIVCPRCKLHFVPRGQTEALQGSDKRQTVLVVEDMDYFQEIARDALATDFNVRTAESVAEAREILRAGGISLLVLDLTLDGGDHGLDLLREFPAKPCPILIYTAKDESEMYGDSWEELQNLGADDIVIKGMNVGESLVRKVSALLGLEVED